MAWRRCISTLFLALAHLSWTAESRRVEAQINVEWPFSPAHALIETSEFLSEGHGTETDFWKFVGEVTSAGWEYTEETYLTSAKFAKEKAAAVVSPLRVKLLGLSLSARAYAPAVELYRQLAYTSIEKGCSSADGKAAAWVHAPQLSDDVICTAADLEALSNGARKSSATGSAPHLFDFDHTYPTSQETEAEVTAILYGVMGTSSMRALHDTLVKQADAGNVRYVLRHLPPKDGPAIPLQGWGAILDIKNMEYKTLDDSKSDGDAEKDENAAEEDVIDGFVFSKLEKWKSSDPEYLNQLAEFKQALVEDRAKHDDIKVWDMKDLGLAAVQQIQRADDPLAKLQDLAQNFPLHAKGLTRTKVDMELREEVQALQRDRLSTGTGRVYINGKARDVSSSSFNVFSFIKAIRAEVGHCEELLSLKLAPATLQALLKPPAEEEEAGGGMMGMMGMGGGGATKTVRVDMRQGMSVVYMNNVEKDAKYKSMPTDMRALLQPSYGLPQVRKNLFTMVLVVDPTQEEGMEALAMLTMIKMQGLPVRMAVAFTSQPLIAAARKGEKLGPETHAGQEVNAWHCGKLLGVLKSKANKKLKAKAKGVDGSTVSPAIAFIEGVSKGAMMALQAQAQGGAAGAAPKLDMATLEEAWQAAGGEAVGAMAEVLSKPTPGLKDPTKGGYEERMTEMVVKKNLPMPSFVLNGIIVPGYNIQQGLQMVLGTEIQVLQKMVMKGTLKAKSNIHNEILSGPNVYPRYHAFLQEDSGAASRSADVNKLSSLLLADSARPADAGNLNFVHYPNTESKAKPLTLIITADFATSEGAELMSQALAYAARNVSSSARMAFVYNPATDAAADGSALAAAIAGAVADKKVVSEPGVESESSGVAKGKVPPSTRFARTAFGLSAGECSLSVNGRHLILSEMECLGFGADDFELLADFELEKRAGAVFDVLNGSGGSGGRSPRETSDLVTKAALLAAEHNQQERMGMSDADLGIGDVDDVGEEEEDDEEPEAEGGMAALMAQMMGKQKKAKRVKRKWTLIDSRGTNAATEADAHAAALAEMMKVVAVLDPLSESTQRIVHVLKLMRDELQLPVVVLMQPATDISEFPLKSFYRYVFHSKHKLGDADGFHGAYFEGLPKSLLLTLKIETPEVWQVVKSIAPADSDNLVGDSRLRFEYDMNHMFLAGQCMDATTRRSPPPNGLLLNLGTMRLGAGAGAGAGSKAVGFHASDTVVMQNLGYFQLKAHPGVWTLNLAEGRGSKLFDIVKSETQPDGSEKEVVTPLREVVIRDFSGSMEQLRVKKKKGMEKKPLLTKGVTEDDGDDGDDGDDAEGEEGDMMAAMQKMLGVKSKAKKASPKHAGDKIHVFSLATGALYERMLRIMMTSVTKRASVPVKFWLLENFVSPEFRASIETLAKAIGFEVGFVSYRWPSWLRKQTEQQRIIWGYKILFLDVLFPLDVTKIIYVDADQVVRADLKELWDLDLEGKAYGYTPFCTSRKETLGFQFWQQGYWKDHLQGKPYHISALYVVDLVVFRREAVGDQLRAVYDNLSRDPNSLSNLDQDLPNYAQNQIEIFSLPQDWLWCESWCSDETKATSKTIDLCNNPLHKEPKLDMAKRVISGEYFDESWVELDDEIKSIIGEQGGSTKEKEKTQGVSGKKEEL